ncbi:MAG: glycoside hydrolase [Actinomycetota bacterium]|nr:glycoside hydrolase [Actinomycetota bacterium]
MRNEHVVATTTGVASSAAPVVARLALAVTLLAGAALAAGVLPGAADSAEAAVVRVGPKVPVTAMDRRVEPANNSPMLVADPTDARFVVMANRLDAPDFGCALQVSGDAGRGWRTATPVPNLPLGADKCYAPEVAFDADGVLYYLFVGLAGRGNEPMGAFLTTSVDRAATFSEPRRVLGPRNFGVRMAIDADHGAKGRIHLVWLHATSDPPLGGFGPPPNPILAAHSDDGGRSFSTPVQVSDPARQRVVAPALALGPDHRVHVAYYDLEDDAVDYQGLEGPVWDGTWSMVVATSSDGGERFGPGVVVDASIVPAERVMLIFTMPPPALATGGGRVCVGWTDARHGDPDVLLRCSNNHGRSWSAPVRANDDRVGNGAHQYLPRLSLAPDGRLDAIFYDRRDTPGNFGTWVYYTLSRDGGRSFSPNTKLSPDVINPTIGQQYGVVSAMGQVEFGSRLGLLSRRDGAVAAWTDTHYSKPPTTGQDIVAAEVQVPGAGRNRGWTRLVGVALVTGAGGVVLLARRRRRPVAVAEL